jgi:hypothetical protein
MFLSRSVDGIISVCIVCVGVSLGVGAGNLRSHSVDGFFRIYVVGLGVTVDMGVDVSKSLSIHDISNLWLCRWLGGAEVRLACNPVFWSWKCGTIRFSHLLRIRRRTRRRTVL